MGCSAFKWAPGTATEVAHTSKSLSQSLDPANANLTAPFCQASEQVREHTFKFDNPWRCYQVNQPTSTHSDNTTTLCNVIGCKCTHIHAKCGQQCCYKHCHALGGCEANGHTQDKKLQVDDTLKLHQPLPPPMEDMNVELTIPWSSFHVPSSPTAVFPASGPSNAVAGPSKSHAITWPSDTVTGFSNTVNKGKGNAPVLPGRKMLPTSMSHPSDTPHYAIHLNPMFTKVYVKAEEADAHQCQQARDVYDNLKYIPWIEWPRSRHL